MSSPAPSRVESFLAGDHLDLRPECLPARRLGRVVRHREIGRMVRAHDHLVDVAEALGRIELVSIGERTNADLGVDREESIDAISGSRQRRIRATVLAWIPEMDAGLISKLDLDTKI